MKRCLAAIVGVLVVSGACFTEPFLAAQDRDAAAGVADADSEPDRVEQEEQAAAEFRERVENRVVEEFRIAAQNRLMLEIEELRRVCGLDAGSVRKLEIAAKGAAERWVRDEEQQLRGHIRFEQYGPDAEIRVGGKKVPRPGEPDPQAAETQPDGGEPPVLKAINRVFGAGGGAEAGEKENVVEISVSVQRYGLQFRVRYRNGSSSHGFGNGLEDLKREAIWSQTYSKVITPEKQKKYEAAVEERRQRLRDAAIVYTIGQLDLDLRLDESQRRRLREVFEAHVTVGSVDPGSVRYQVERQIKEIDPDVLKPILSEPQLYAWREYASW